MTNKIKGISGTLALATALAFGTSSTPALAADTGLVTLNAVEYSGGTLLIQTSTGSNYVGVLNTGGACTANNQNIDTLKAWTSMAQSALLSGKRLKIYFTVCGGSNFINVVDLWN